MKILNKHCIPVLFWMLSLACYSGEVKVVDVCVYGGTSAGVIAAYTAKQSGKSVVLVEPGKNLGGMSSGGLGYTDIGNKYVVTGLARDFYRKLGDHYGKLEQWIFEPKVAEAIFNEYTRKAGVEVWLERRVKDVKKTGTQIREIRVEDSGNPKSSSDKTIRAKMYIDCSYEGDLMAKSGVSYAIGRESNDLYNETFNGVQILKNHQFPDGIDPYVVPGKKESGLLWGIGTGALQPKGSGDKKIQAYNFRITLTNRPENRIPVTKPDHYDPAKYELLIRLKEKTPWKSFRDVFIWSMMPNGKTDINNFGGFSTDAIGMNWNYPEASYKERAEIWKEHEDYTKGLLYFIGNDPRIPEFVRDEMKQWGYPKDEYTGNNHWTHQLYVRECRRMIGGLVMTQHHCQGKEVCEDVVGWAAYTMDSHNCDRIVVNGMVKNEGNVEEGGFGPYPVSYRSITPKRQEACNLLVPVCLSASHIAYGSIRMEPVFMVLAQSAAVAACLAIDKKLDVVQEVDVNAIRRQLKDNPLADGSIPELLVDNNDPELVTVSGDWKTGKRGGYGPDFLYDDQPDKVLKTVRFAPDVIHSGTYQVYVYFPKRKTISSRTHLVLSDGKQPVERIIKDSDIVVEGQTSGEWVSIGSYSFEKGRKGYVEITNKDADGEVIADAVLFVFTSDNPARTLQN